MTDSEAAKVVGIMAIATHFAWTPEKLKVWAASILDVDYDDARQAVRQYIRDVEPIEFSVKGFRAICDEKRRVREARTPKLDEPKASPAQRKKVYAELGNILSGLKTKMTMPGGGA